MVPKRHHIEDLYLQAFGTRERTFVDYGSNVTAADDSGGIVVCHTRHCDEVVSKLIAELLNQARDMALKR